MKKKIAIIPARGGSKRIPNKNILDFCGKPILAYSIENAINSGLFDEVMVSTDSEEIANIALDYNAKVPFFRSKQNSNDYATTEDVIIEVLNEYKKMGYEYEYACCIYPTAPLVNIEVLKESMAVMEKHNPAVVIPLVAFSYPPQRCFVIDEKGMAKFKYPEYVNSRSQDLEKMYHDAGQFYIYKIDKLFITNGDIIDDFMPVVLPEMKVQDIDSLEDWKIAEMKYKMIQEELK